MGQLLTTALWRRW